MKLANSILSPVGDFLVELLDGDLLKQFCIMVDTRTNLARNLRITIVTGV